MKRITTAACSAALLLAGCGGSGHHGSTPQERQDAQRVDRIVAKCLPNPLSLRSRRGRQKFGHCAVPPKNAKPFSACIEKVVLHGIPTVKSSERGATACVSKYA